MNSTPMEITRLIFLFFKKKEGRRTNCCCFIREKLLARPRSGDAGGGAPPSRGHLLPLPSLPSPERPRGWLRGSP
jgi:hypothetical protein